MTLRYPNKYTFFRKYVLQIIVAIDQNLGVKKMLLDLMYNKFWVMY